MKEIVNKNKKEKGDTRKYLKKKWYLFLILFLTIFSGVLLGYISGPLQRDSSTTYFALCGVGIIILGILDMLIILKIRFDMKKNKKIYKNLMFYFFFICLFLSGLILTIAFRILSLNNPDSIFNKGNLISLLCSLSYLLLLALAVFFPLEKETPKLDEADKNVTPEVTNIDMGVKLDTTTKQEEVMPLKINVPKKEEVTLVVTPKKEKLNQNKVVNKPINKVVTKKTENKEPSQELIKQYIRNIFKNYGIEDAIRLEVRKQQKEEMKKYFRPVVFNGQVFTSEEFSSLVNNPDNKN